MSAVLTPAAATPAPARVPALKVTQGRVLLSEFTKFRSLRSTMWTLLAGVVLMIGIGALFSGVTASQYHTFSAAERAAFHPVTTSLNGVVFAVVAFGVLGALLRNTAAGIATFAAVFFVIPPLAGLLPASISNHLAQYLPSNAGGVLWGGAANVHNALSPWTGFALLCGYAAVLIGAGAWRLRRSDA
jgi:ABC-2 type transport system permease protein